MSGLSVVTIAFGLFILVARGPLIFAPTGTIDVYRKFLDTTTRIRALGVCVSVLSAGMVLLARGSEEPAAQIIEVIGWFVAVAVVVLLLIVPSLYRQMALAMLDAVQDAMVLRFMGVLGTAFGVFVIYLGFALAGRS